MRKEHAEESWFHWLSNYFFCREAVQLYAVMGTIALIKHHAGGELLPSGSALQQTIKDHPHVWLPPVTTLFVNSIGIYFGRCRENREVRRMYNMRADEHLYADMDTHQKLGDQAMQQHQYYLAVEHFSASHQIFNQIFSNSIRARAKQLYLNCIFKHALALFSLKCYDEAKSLLNEILSDKNYKNEMQLRIWLLNLRGIINFTLGGFPIYSASDTSNLSELWRLAKEDFEESYRADQAQNNIYLYLQYLRGNHKFLVENTPYPLLAPKVNLAFNGTDIMSENIMLLCADACYKQQNWAKAIFLYENYLDAQSESSNAFLDLFLTTLACFNDYAELLKSASSDTNFVLLDILIEEEGDEEKPQIKQSLVQRNYTIAQVKERALKKIDKAKTLLEAELFLTNDTFKLVKMRCNYGDSYLMLAEALKLMQFESVALPKESELIAQSLEHFKEAQKLLREQLPREKDLLAEVRGSIKKLTSNSDVKSRVKFKRQR